MDAFLLRTREDVVFSQALSALVESFRTKIHIMTSGAKGSAAMTPLSADMNWLYDNYLDVLAELGYIFQLESLLSIQGAEKHMLQDAVAAIESLNHVEICLVDSGNLED